MPSTSVSMHGQWSSKLAFVLAASGSAVGLGNIWKFPYMAGENGGGAFVLIYLLCIGLFGIPVMMAEVALGRRGRQSPINTMSHLAREEGRSQLWSILGWVGVIAGFLILSYYSVIAGWALFYVTQGVQGSFAGITEQGAGALFGELISDPKTLTLWHSVFIVMTMVIVARGVSGGLEKAVKYLMPALLFLMLLLVAYAIVQGDFARGASFLFAPDFSKLNHNVVLQAMGQAFFTLSLGMGAIMVYGAYLPKDASIAKTSFAVAGADTSIALLAGLAIFPIVFANNLAPGQGPGLIFTTLPLAFGQMPGGILFGTLFFILLVFAAWTSSISLIEPAIAWLVERLKLTRVMASVVAGIATWLLGMGTVLSFNHWDGIRAFVYSSEGFEWIVSPERWEFLKQAKEQHDLLNPASPFLLEGKTFFDVLDYLTANIMLPLGGLFIALFVGWFMRSESVKDEVAIENSFLYGLWRVLLRYVTPLGVGAVFLHVIGVI